MSDPSTSSAPAPEVFKNVQSFAVDVGGRLVAPGEIAELPPTRRAVVHAIDAGHLVALNTTPADDPTPPPDAAPAGPSVERRRARTSTTSEES